jgi:hypothetical protein
MRIVAPSKFFLLTVRPCHHRRGRRCEQAVMFGHDLFGKPLHTLR